MLIGIAFICLLLTGTIAFAAKPVVTMMTWGDPKFAQKQMDIFLEVYPEYKDKVEFKFVIGGQNDQEVAQKLRLGLAANEVLPEVIQMNRTQYSEFVEAGALEDLTPYFKDVQSNLTAGAKALTVYKGKYYAFPYELKAKLWFYRKDMFDAAGIDVTKVKNTDDLIAAGKKLQAKFPGSYIWNMGPVMAAYNLGEIVSGNGAKLIDAKGNYILAKDPGVSAAFQDFKKLQDSGVIAPVQDWTPDWEAALAKGTVASQLIGSWMKAFLPGYAPDGAGKWAVTTWPVIGRADGGSEAAGSLFTIAKNSKNKKLAIEIYKKAYMTKDCALAEFQKSGSGYIPYTLDALADPALQKPDSYFVGNTFMTAFAEALKKFKVFPYDPAADKEFKVLNQYLVEYYNGRLSLDEALTKAETDLKSLVGNPLKK